MPSRPKPRTANFFPSPIARDTAGPVLGSPRTPRGGDYDPLNRTLFEDIGSATRASPVSRSRLSDVNTTSVPELQLPVLSARKPPRQGREPQSIADAHANHETQQVNLPKPVLGSSLASSHPGLSISQTINNTEPILSGLGSQSGSLSPSSHGGSAGHVAEASPSRNVKTATDAERAVQRLERKWSQSPKEDNIAQVFAANDTSTSTQIHGRANARGTAWASAVASAGAFVSLSESNTERPPAAGYHKRLSPPPAPKGIRTPYKNDLTFQSAVRAASQVAQSFASEYRRSSSALQQATSNTSSHGEPFLAVVVPLYPEHKNAIGEPYIQTVERVSTPTSTASGMPVVLAQGAGSSTLLPRDSLNLRASTDITIGRETPTASLLGIETSSASDLASTVSRRRSAAQTLQARSSPTPPLASRHSRDYVKYVTHTRTSSPTPTDSARPVSRSSSRVSTSRAPVSSQGQLDASFRSTRPRPRDSYALSKDGTTPAAAPLKTMMASPEQSVSHSAARERPRPMPF